MTRQELIQAISRRTRLTPQQADSALAALIDSISGALAKGEDVTLIGFGRFEARVQPPHPGRNPRTGEPIAVGATARVRFHQGASLARRIEPLLAKYAADASAAA